VDVREPFERVIADLPPYGQLSLPVKFVPQAPAHLNPDDEIVVYCRSGQRSAWATEQLMHLGFQKVLNLKGGLMAWGQQVDSSFRGY
jgi:adenylyltransferase/sulfurtransferase